MRFPYAFQSHIYLLQFDLIFFFRFVFIAETSEISEFIIIKWKSIEKFVGYERKYAKNQINDATTTVWLTRVYSTSKPSAIVHFEIDLSFFFGKKFKESEEKRIGTRNVDENYVLI